MPNELLPNNIGYGTVVGRFGSAPLIAGDADGFPDFSPATGLTVTFTPSTAAVIDATASPAPVTIEMVPIVCGLDTQGYLVGGDGQRGVKLIATNDTDINPSGWTYSVTFLRGGAKVAAFRDFSMSLPAGVTKDIALTIPVPSSEGVSLSQAQAAEAAAVSAASQASASAAAAAAAAATFVPATVDTLGQAGTTGKALAKTSSATAARAAIQAQQESIVDVRKFGAIGDGTNDDTAAFQAAIDSLIVGSAITSVGTSGPITIPARNGGRVIVPAGDWRVTNLVVKDFVCLEGVNSGVSRITVSGSITYATVHNTAYYTAWGVGLKSIRIIGAAGTETLFGPGVVTDVTKNRTEHVLVEGVFEDVLFEHGGIGFDLRGWNNRVARCWFRDCDIGTNLDTAAKRTSLNSPVANPGDNVFEGCTWNDCTVSVKARWAKNTIFLDCAPYRADDKHYWFGESCDGNLVLGGRMEDAPNYLMHIEGGQLVKNGGSTVYQCISIHAADSTNEPGVGASWATFWRVTTNWTTQASWVSGTSYFSTNALGNKLDTVDFYYGLSPRPGRRGATITRSANYKAVKLDGDQHTRVRDCRSGASTSEQVEISDLSISAVLTDNVNIRASFIGVNAAKFSEAYQPYGTGARTQTHNTLVTKLNQLQFEGETANYYWTYAQESPRAYLFRSASNVSLRIREASGVVSLPKNKFVTDLATFATSTVVSVVNVSSTDIALITPRNAAAATFQAANAASIYAVPEANDKIRIYHPNTAPATCTFNVVIL